MAMGCRQRWADFPEWAKNMAQRRKPLLPEDMPVGLKPIYPMASVKQEIILYEGDVELEQGTKRLSGKGVVQFRWLPRPGLQFSSDLSPKNQQRPELEDGTLHLLGINWHAKVSV